jgi:hypothetical protein
MENVIEVAASRELRSHESLFAVNRAKHADWAAEHEETLNRKIKLQRKFVLYVIRFFVENLNFMSCFWHFVIFNVRHLRRVI